MVHTTARTIHHQL